MEATPVPRRRAPPKGPAGEVQGRGAALRREAGAGDDVVRDRPRAVGSTSADSPASACADSPETTEASSPAEPLATAATPNARPPSAPTAAAHLHHAAALACFSIPRVRGRFARTRAGRTAHEPSPRGSTSPPVGGGVCSTASSAAVSAQFRLLAERLTASAAAGGTGIAARATAAARDTARAPSEWRRRCARVRRGPGRGYPRRDEQLASPPRSSRAARDVPYRAARCQLGVSEAPPRGARCGRADASLRTSPARVLRRRRPRSPADPHEAPHDKGTGCRAAECHGVAESEDAEGVGAGVPASARGSPSAARSARTSRPAPARAPRVVERSTCALVREGLERTASPRSRWTLRAGSWRRARSPPRRRDARGARRRLRSSLILSPDAAPHRAAERSTRSSRRRRNLPATARRPGPAENASARDGYRAGTTMRSRKKNRPSMARDLARRLRARRHARLSLAAVSRRTARRAPIDRRSGTV